ncbi:hypothetical protein FRACYDRAFT_250208 [Fragilariopsis cylindrus CCMP1102]|uniref:Alpha/beta-hydrolase n=1 Tax=Fragilariopsis cylindrus CCMP1102 TaxID=635003 RepID=A0A1E7EPV9_9STRA|nr:hypothetical protein FRACYDRAFT_250208 [Fragilariopsis cylindrus CCMP1102]|eukprot:OEU07988.1 hypothetical protein FRACYDRAFT_250208 [Fragilariopsis cylindrus CCMP1102]
MKRTFKSISLSQGKEINRNKMKISNIVRVSHLLLAYYSGLSATSSGVEARRLDEKTRDDALENKASFKLEHIDQYYSCGSTWHKKTAIDYPNNSDNNGKSYPVVLFARGSGGWSDDYKPWLRSIAEQDLIVIAPEASISTPAHEAIYASVNITRCKEDGDLEYALEWALKNPDRLGATPDWSRIGVVGHSQGAKHIPTFIFMNDKIQKKATTKVKDFYNTAPHPKLYAELLHGGHGEQHGENCSKPYCYQLGKYTGHFLACYLSHTKSSCEKIKGICDDSSAPMEECINIKQI